MKTRLVSTFAALLCFSTLALSQTPPGWKTTIDMNRKCQIAFPSTWQVNDPPDGQANAADGGRAVIVVGSSDKLKPLSPEWQKLYAVQRILENTAERVFFVSNHGDETVQYIVDQQFKGVRCNAQIIVPKRYPEDEIIRIAATLALFH